MNVPTNNRFLDARPGDVGTFHLEPVDFRALIADGIPEVEWVDEPYAPRAFAIWSFGPTEAAKSIYWEWRAARITRAGGRVVFVSEENPLAVDVDRIVRLGANLDNLVFFNGTGIDLADPVHLAELWRVADGADLIVFDTLSACWSGNENDNAEVVAFDREVVRPTIRQTGAAVVVIHHTGHPQAFVKRGGASSGRGASALGQKPDVIVVFAPTGQHEFSIEHAKNRVPGGRKEPKTTFRIIDTDDGGLDIEPLGATVDLRVGECADEAVRLIGDSGSDGIGATALKAALKAGGFGTDTVFSAFDVLRTEEPLRVRQVTGHVLGADGKRYSGKPWVVVDNQVGPGRSAGRSADPPHEEVSGRSGGGSLYRDHLTDLTSSTERPPVSEQVGPDLPGSPDEVEPTWPPRSKACLECGFWPHHGGHSSECSSFVERTYWVGRDA